MRFVQSTGTTQAKTEILSLGFVDLLVHFTRAPHARTFSVISNANIFLVPKFNKYQSCTSRGGFRDPDPAVPDSALQELVAMVSDLSHPCPL